MSENPVHTAPHSPESLDDIPGPLERRGFLKLAAGALGACYAAAIGYPVYRYLASPVEQAAQTAAVTEVTLPDGTLDLPKNTAVMFKFGVKPAILIHHEDDSWSALSAVCTHLGCTVSYEQDKQVLYCPCHGGVYNATTGANIAGPPPKPLTEYKVAISNGKITVSRA